MISSNDIPEATMRTIVATGSRLPRMHARPPILPGSMVIRVHSIARVYALLPRAIPAPRPIPVEFPMRPAVFLDRDDTLIVNRALTAATPHPGSLFDPALVRLTPGAAAALRDLKRAGFALIVVSNHGCIPRA